MISLIMAMVKTIHCDKCVLPPPLSYLKVKTLNRCLLLSHFTYWLVVEVKIMKAQKIYTCNGEQELS